MGAVYLGGSAIDRALGAEKVEVAPASNTPLQRLAVEARVRDYVKVPAGAELFA
jgi:hypothetical protein